MDNKWDWQEQFSSDRTVACYRCIGFSIQEKGSFCSFRIHDIPSEGRRELAYKLHLNEYDFEDWAELSNVETYRDQYYFTVSVEKAWLKSSFENWNWTKKMGFWEETAEYTCPGWKCSKEILQKVHQNQLSVFDIPSFARDSLAQTVGLDRNEIGEWVSKFKVWIDEEGIHVSVHVPNVWITANILAFDWDPISSAAAVGGLIGAAATSGYVQVISGMKEVRCDTFQSLLLALDQYEGKIWGFTLFAHGHQSGVITDKKSGGIINWQNELLNKVEQNKYKLGQINLMQCFSGYKGIVTLGEKELKSSLNLHNDKLLEKVKSVKYVSQPIYLTSLEQKVISYIQTALESQGYFTVKNISGIRFKNKEKLWEFFYYADIEVNWEAEWKNYCLKLYSYQHMNVCLLDIVLPDKIVEEIKTYMKNSFNTLF